MPIGGHEENHGHDQHDPDHRYPLQTGTHGDNTLLLPCSDVIAEERTVKDLPVDAGIAGETESGDDDEGCGRYQWEDYAYGPYREHDGSETFQCHQLQTRQTVLRMISDSILHIHPSPRNHVDLISESMRM